MQGIKNKFHGFSENFFVDILWNTQEKKKKVRVGLRLSG